MDSFRKILNLSNFLISLSVIAALLWYHGFEYAPHYLHPHLLYLNACFVFYLVQFFIRAKLSGSLSNYLKRNILESFLFIAFILDVLSSQFLNYSLAREVLFETGIENHDHLYMLFLHIWLLIIVGIELGKATSRSTIWKFSPPVLFILSFVVLIVAGSSLLMLPKMTSEGNEISFIDALFTSISANCVTGLTVVDTATYFSFKGKLLILLLIQLGGLNIIAFATYFMSFFRTNGIANKSVQTIKELLHTKSLGSTKEMVKIVVLTTLFIELVGTLILYRQWDEQSWLTSDSQRLFYSAFHAISSFNNAGFTLFSDGFTHLSIRDSYFVHITIAFLIVLGSVGFSSLHEIFSGIRNGFKATFSTQSRIAWCTSLLLITIGAAIFYGCEYDNTLSQKSFSQGMISAIFQSVTARTAGFNTISFANITNIALATTMILMFIGASTGSTGGGIKTSTFTVLIAAIAKRKEKALDYGKSFLSVKLVKKAITILLYSLGVIAASLLVLVLVEPDKDFSELCFEEISAFSTTGLSTGITPDLSSPGKLVLMFSMFVGRVGPLALASMLAHAAWKPNLTVNEGVMIG